MLVMFPWVKHPLPLCAESDARSKAALTVYAEMENILLWVPAQPATPQLVLDRCRASATPSNLLSSSLAGRG